LTLRLLVVVCKPVPLEPLVLLEQAECTLVSDSNIARKQDWRNQRRQCSPRLA
jgi:hypothetical protein